MPYQTLHQSTHDLDAPGQAELAQEAFERNNRLFARCAVLASVAAVGAAVLLSTL